MVNKDDEKSIIISPSFPLEAEFVARSPFLLNNTEYIFDIIKNHLPAAYLAKNKTLNPKMRVFSQLDIKL